MTRLPAMIALLTVSLSATADLQHDVECREIGFSKSVENRDADLFVSFIDSDARFVGDAVTKGPAAILELWSGFLAIDGPLIKWRPQFIEVLENGKLALTRGPYKMITRDEKGNLTEHWGTFNSVWRLHDDGQWRVVFDAGDGSRDAPADEVRALLDAADNCAPLPSD